MIAQEPFQFPNGGLLLLLTLHLIYTHNPWQFGTAVPGMNKPRSDGFRYGLICRNINGIIIGVEKLNIEIYPKIIGLTYKNLGRMIHWKTRHQFKKRLELGGLTQNSIDRTQGCLYGFINEIGSSVGLFKYIHHIHLNVIFEVTSAHNFQSKPIPFCLYQGPALGQ